MKRILVTGAGGSAAANFISSLRMADEPFFIVGTDVKPYHLELAAVEKRYLVPAATQPDYIDALNRVILLEKIDMIHPQPDIEVKQLSERREEILAKHLLPAKETIRLCQDKWGTVNFLAGRGIPTGKSFLVSDKEELRKTIGEILDGTRLVWIRARCGAGARASLRVGSFEQAATWVDYWTWLGKLNYGEFMITEFLPGKEFAFQSLWENGKLVTSQARERIEYIFRHLSPSGQTSSPSVARTVHRDDVNKIASDAVLAVDGKATGIFCVDLKENIQGIPCVTEINAGRFFTTSNFFAEAGSNMPYYFVKMAYGEELPPLPQYNPIASDLYWVRMVDMGYKLVREGEWTSIQI